LKSARSTQRAGISQRSTRQEIFSIIHTIYTVLPLWLYCILGVLIKLTPGIGVKNWLILWVGANGEHFSLRSVSARWRLLPSGTVWTVHGQMSQDWSCYRPPSEETVQFLHQRISRSGWKCVAPSNRRLSTGQTYRETNPPLTWTHQTGREFSKTTAPLPCRVTQFGCQ
jgi:hypothetical protein